MVPKRKRRNDFRSCGLKITLLNTNLISCDSKLKEGNLVLFEEFLVDLWIIL